MTLRDPLRCWPVQLEEGFEAYEVNGLPVDCVNLSLCEHFPRGCDMVLSGINAGPNLGWDITYSGTVGGALEGAINGIPSAAISVAKFVDDGPTHVETAADWVAEWFDWLLQTAPKHHGILNVNVPNIASAEIRGTHVTRAGMRVYEDKVERRSDPWGRPYYWQGGAVVMDNTVEGTDVHSVSQGFVSVTPVRLDWTDHASIERLQQTLP
jgi:5'-nucleotidase